MSVAVENGGNEEIVKFSDKDLINNSIRQKPSKSSVLGYGLPQGSDYPNISRVVAAASDKTDRYSRDDLKDCETCNNGYIFYKIRNAVFAKDISGYFYKLNNESKHFEWFSEGWLEDNVFSIGITIPSAPTYISYNKDGLPVYPMNDEKPPKPILPKNEKGEKVFPVDQSSQVPLFPVDFNGEPCLPVGDDGRPIFPMGSEGKPLVPIDSNGVAVFPRNEDGLVLFPEREDGRPIPPYTIYGNPVVPFKLNGEPDLPVDANGQPLIFMGGEDGMTPMTEEEYHQWQYTMAIYGQTYSKEYGYDPNSYETTQNEQLLEAYKHDYYQQYGYENALPMVGAVGSGEMPVNPAQVEAEKKKKLLAMQMKSLKKAKALEENKDGEGNKEKSTPPPVAPLPPSNSKPPLPNKEKERGERYIPEPISRRPYRRDYRKMSKDDVRTLRFRQEMARSMFKNSRHASPKDDEERGSRDSARGSRRSISPLRRSPLRRSRRSRSRGKDRRRSRSRSGTWSPEPRKSESRRKRSRSGSAERRDRRERRRREKKRSRRDSDASSGSSDD